VEGRTPLTAVLVDMVEVKALWVDILELLDDALMDGDPNRTAIRGSGLSQVGKTETITTPSQDAQRTLIREIYRNYGLDPAQTAYFVAHSTGTPTSDPI
jgi:acyl transferase domain-containing protein